MKLAWICYPHDTTEDPDDLYPIFLFVEPEDGIWRKVIPIVYAVLESD